MDDAGILVWLRRCALFGSVPDASLARIVRTLKRRRYRRDEVIFHAGDPGDVLHVITLGAVKIVLASEEGAEAILVTLGVGDSFGELALLDGSPRSASAVAVGAVETLTVGRPVMRELMAADERLRDEMLTGAGRVIRRLTDQLSEFHFLDLGGRLAVRLARLARAIDPDARSVSLDWPHTQGDLAAMIGGARQSVNRLLVGLVDEALVRFEGDRLVIPDVDALLAAGER